MAVDYIHSAIRYAAALRSILAVKTLGEARAIASLALISQEGVRPDAGVPKATAAEEPKL